MPNNNKLPTTKEDVMKLGAEFALKNGFNLETQNPAHDACHAISGIPADSEKSENKQWGWEAAILGVSPKENVNEDLIDGYLQGCLFLEKYPVVAQLLAWCLQNI